MSSLIELRQVLQAAGARPRHETLILRAWTRGLPLDEFGRRPDSPFPRALRAAMPDLVATFDGLLNVRSRHLGADGSTRLLLGLKDGQTVESVWLPNDGRLT